MKKSKLDVMEWLYHEINNTIRQTAMNLAAAGETSKDGANGNDDYVDYLSQGGSIFELAKMLDDDLEI